MKPLGNKVLTGINTYFSYINETNALNGVKIKPLVYDDKYEPELTEENTLLLMNKNVFGFIGTPTIKKILPILKIVLFPL